MDWNRYTEQPDEGLFEKIEQRVSARRVRRTVSAVAGVVAAIVAVAVVLWPGAQQNNAGQEAVNEVATVQQHEEPMMQETTVTAVAEAEAEAAKRVDASMSTPFATQEEIAAMLPEQQVLPTVAEPEMPELLADYAAGSKLMPVAEVGRKSAVGEKKTSATTASSTKAGQPEEPAYHEDNVVWAPNIITPNGDIDDNRTFKIKATSTLVDFHIYIFDRRGQRVYSSNDPSFEWDGTHDGKAMPQGAYVWVATFRGNDGKQTKESGTVLVLR